MTFSLFQMCSCIFPTITLYIGRDGVFHIYLWTILPNIFHIVRHSVSMNDLKCFILTMLQNLRLQLPKASTLGKAM